MKQASLLREKVKSTDKKYIKYRIVAPEGPLQVFGMDIKMVWIEEHRRHALHTQHNRHLYPSGTLLRL